MAEKPEMDAAAWSNERGMAAGGPYASVGRALKAGLCIAGALPVFIGIGMILWPFAGLLSR
jgi:hypothetical protein